MDRHATVDRFLKKFSDTLGYSVGDIVSYAPTGYRVMGIVVDIDPKIHKIFVDWAGCGNVHQHDPDEIQLTQIQDKKVQKRMADNRMARIAGNIVGDVQTTKFLADETADLLNKQFANELANSAFYRVCASWFENNGFPGFRAYFLRQGDGEASHAMKVYEFLVNAGVQVAFPAMTEQAIPAGVSAIVRAALIKETETTKNWQIITEAVKRDHNAAACELCQWFMKEQMEEESSISILMQKIMNLPVTGEIEVIDKLLRTEEPTMPIKVASEDRRV